MKLTIRSTRERNTGIPGFKQKKATNGCAATKMYQITQDNQQKGAEHTCNIPGQLGK